jgi:hypothetical protein
MDDNRSFHGFFAQRKDKVLLFKALRDDLERVKAGTLDTNKMQAIRLSMIDEQ